MIRKSPFLAFVSLWLLVSPLWAQSLLNTFSIDQPPQNAGFYFPYEDENGTAQLFVYPKRFDLRVLYLDQDFNLLDDVIVHQENKALDEFTIVACLDKKDSLRLIVQFKGEPYYSSLIYHKRERSLKRTGLKIPYQTSNLLLPPVLENGTLTSVQIARKEAKIIVNRTSDGYTLQSDTFAVEVADLYKKLYWNDDLAARLNTDPTIAPTLITAAGGNSLFHNALDYKIYLYDSKLHLSLEDLENRTMQHVEIDLISKQQRLREYPLPRINNEALLQANSLVYEDWLLLSSYQKSGLKLAIYAFGAADPIQTYEFATELEMAPYFGPAGAERQNAGDLGFDYYLRRSLIMSLIPTATGDFELVIGSLPEMSFGAGMTLGEASLRAGLYNNVDRLLIHPLQLADQLPPFAFSRADQYRNMVYRVATLNAGDLSLKRPASVDLISPELSPLNPSLYRKMNDFLMLDRSYWFNTEAQLIFSYQNGIVHAFANRKGELKLYYFE